jgi:hypothetical protein
MDTPAIYAALVDLLSQVKSCDGTAQIDIEKAEQAIAAWNQRSAVGNCPELKNLVAAIDAEYHPESQGQYFTTELCSAIDAARAAVDNPLASAWQPIEAAPRDGTEILAIWTGKRRPRIVWFDRARWTEDGDHSLIDFTHWQHLPSLPPITP